MRDKWIEARLGSVFKLTSGKTKPDDLQNARSDATPFPVFGGNGVLGWSSQSNADGENIIIGRVGALCGCVHYYNGPCWITDNALYARDYLVDADRLFLAYLLEQVNLAQFRAAGGQPLVSQGPIHSHKVSFPSSKIEQRRISEILRTWDDAAEKTERLIAATEKRLSWLRSNLLTGKRRLPGYKAEWNTPPLGEILVEHKLKSFGDEQVFSVSVHKGLINQIEHLGRSFAAKETSHYNRVQPGDIVYTKSPTGDFPLGIIKLSKIDKSVIVSPLYGVFTPVNPHVGVMLDTFFESPVNTKNYLAPLVQKGAKNTIAITNKRFLEGHLSVPTDVVEQAALADLVSTAKVERDALRARATMLERQKRGLMQKLLTGTWRVPIRDNEEECAERAAKELTP